MISNRYPKTKMTFEAEHFEYEKIRHIVNPDNPMLKSELFDIDYNLDWERIWEKNDAEKVSTVQSIL